MTKYLNPSNIRLSDDIMIIDVRERDELERTGTVKGATHISLYQLVERVGEIPKEKPVYVYCAAGGRASGACEFLESQGYSAYNTGGISDWYYAGHPIVDI